MFGIQLDDVKVNGVSLGFCGKEGSGAQRTNCLITVDSGSSMMAMPSFAYEQLEGMGKPSMTNPVNCASQKDFGELTFVINGIDYTFQPEEWVYPPTPQSSLAQSGQESKMSSVAA